MNIRDIKLVTADKIRKRFYIKLLLIIAFLIFVFFIGMSINMFVGSISTTKNAFHQRNENSLNMIMQNAQNQMDIVLNIQYQVIADKNLAKYVTSKELSNSEYALILFELMNSLWSKAAPVKIIENLAVYVNKNDYIVNINGAEDRSSFLNKYLYKVNDSSEMDTILRGGQKVELFTRKVTYEKSVELIGIINNTSSNFSNISIITHLKPRELLRTSQDYNDMTFLVYEPHAGVIASTGNPVDLTADAVDRILEIKKGFLQIDISNEKYFLYFDTYEPFQWQFICIVPSRTMERDINKLLILMVLSTVGLLIVGLLIALMLTGVIYSPISKMLHQLNSETQADSLHYTNRVIDEFEFFYRKISEIKQNNIKLLDALHQNKNVIREKLIKDLLAGNFMQENVQTAFKDLDIVFDKSCYIVVGLSIDDFITFQANNTREVINYMVKNILDVISTSFKGEFNNEVADIGYENIALIINFNDQPEDYTKIRNIIRNIQDIIRLDLNITVTAAIGKAYNHITDISTSFKEALQILEYKHVIGQGKIIRTEDIQKYSETNFYYPVELERNIINSAVTGNFNIVKEIIQELMEDNFSEKKLTSEARYHLLSAIAGTIVRVLNRLNLTPQDLFSKDYNIYDEIRNYDGLYHLKNKILNIYSAICEYVNESNKNNEDRLKEKLVDYIHNHYKENFSLNDMAEEFNFTSAYLSKTFKEKVGENFIEYLNKYRVGVAKDLLMHTNMQINEIAEEVGYINTTSFIRVFKKYEGVSPGKFKEIF